jgi:hypothetical protein
VAALLVVTLAPLVSSCRSGVRDVLVTYFNGDFAVSLRHPASWKAQQTEQDGVFYRYVLGPPGLHEKPAVSATLLVGRPGARLEEYAQTYLAGNTAGPVRDEERQGAKGKDYTFSSPDGTMRYELLLVEEKGRVFGLYCQAEAPSFERYAPVLAEMRQSLTLERTALYVEQRNEALAYSFRLPSSWRETRHFTGGGRAVLQFTSPPLAVDKTRETVHASLSLSVEPAPDDGTLESYYHQSRINLGDSFQILDHKPWRGGYADVLRTETPLAMSQVKRFYKVESGRAYSLTLEARDDVFPRVGRWYDLIAGTFRAGNEMKTP